MSLPIIIVCGAAGTGKDTVGAMLAKKMGGVCIAQADPMKRFCAQIFDWDEKRLWGPSEARNEPDPRYGGPDAYLAFNTAADRLDVLGRSWVEEIGVPKALGDLKAWFRWMSLDHMKEKRILTARYALQTIGTEFGRRVQRNVWVNYTRNHALELLGGGYGYDRTKGLIENKGVPTPTVVVVTDGRFPNEVVAVKAGGGEALLIQSSNLSAEAQQAGVQGHASETSLALIPNNFWDYTLYNNKEAGLKNLEACVETLISSMDKGLTVLGSNLAVDNKTWLQTCTSF